MSTYTTERENFLLLMRAEGMAPEIGRRILRHANTIQRLSVAECNGDYPCDNGERKVEPCSRCEAGYVRSSMTRDKGKPRLFPSGHFPLICPNCRAQDLIATWCAKAGEAVDMRQLGSGMTREQQHTQLAAIAEAPLLAFVPVFQGDPRGACVKLKVPSGKADDLGGVGICVPTRRY